MIEKFDDQNGFCMADCMNKINEVIDAVNELQKDYDNVCVWVGEQKLKTPAENAQDRMIGCTTLDIPESYKTDPYAEQRWVGHLCKLWTGDGLVRYGILRGVALNRKKTKYPYQALSTSFEHCEPVKPDSELIYHGE